MRKLFSLLTVFFALSTVSFAVEGDKDALIKQEKAIWQTVQDKKVDAFSKYLTSDFRSVYKDGIMKLDQEVDAVKKADLKSVTFGEMDVVFVNKNAALVTYKITVQGTQDGKDVSGSYNCASVWKRSENEWRGAFHTEVKAE